MGFNVYDDTLDKEDEELESTESTLSEN